MAAKDKIYLQKAMKMTEGEDIAIILHPESLYAEYSSQHARCSLEGTCLRSYQIGQEELTFKIRRASATPSL